MVSANKEKHLWIGGWVLAGLLVVGFNGFALASLLDTPLSGYSHGVRAVDRGIRQFKTILTAKTDEIGSGLDALNRRFMTEADPVSSPGKTKPSPTTPKKRAAILPVRLPPLTGIVTRSGTQGAAHRLAMLDGAIYTEGEKCGVFVIKEISDRGVLLVKGSRTWFVEAPAVAHSLTMR